MINNIKQFLLTMLLALVSISASAYDFKVDGIYYNITSIADLTCEVTCVEYNSSNPHNSTSYYTGNVVIPESVEYNGLKYTVTGIGRAAFNKCSSLVSVDLPSSITTIGHEAFENCSSLTTIDLPSSITTIGYYAFYGCSSLTSIDLPSSVTTIGNYAFYGCSSLTSIDLPSSLTTIGEYTFSNCSSLISIDLPSSLTTIGGFAFRGCSSLTSIDLPASITTIEDYAFCVCSSLMSIDLPASITTIGNYAFEACSSLTSIELPKSVVKIGDNPFYGCKQLTDLRVAEDNQNYYFADDCLTSKDGVLITGLNLSHITVPSSVTTIGNSAFSGCSSLISIDLPSSITTIGQSAFYGCSSLTSIDLPSSITTIGESAFSGCSSLTSIDLPSSITTIGCQAFVNCTSLKSITLPSPITTIEWGTFSGCSSLISIDLPSYLTTIKSSAFSGCAYLKTINLPSSITTISDNVFQNSYIQNVTFGCLPVLAKKISYSYLREITLMDNLTNFLSYEFNKCTKLKKLTSLALEPPTLVANQFSESQYQNLEVLVPDEALAKYKTANVWKDFANLKGINGTVVEVKKCEKPTIAYADGELTFTCGTEGARFVYSVRENCTVSNATSTGKSTMRPKYTVTAYATADGYQNSDVATATFDLSDGYKEVEKEVIVYVYDSNEPTDIALETGETIKLYLSKGKATVVAAPFGTVISVYSNTGAMVKTLTVGGIVTDIELPTDNIYIIKVGTKVFKVKV